MYVLSQKDGKTLLYVIDGKTGKVYRSKIPILADTQGMLVSEQAITLRLDEKQSQEISFQENWTESFEEIDVVKKVESKP